jgi:hypothetical protein
MATLCVVLSLLCGYFISRFVFNLAIDLSSWLNSRLISKEGEQKEGKGKQKQGEQATVKFGVGKYENEISIGCTVLGTVIALVYSLHAALAAHAYFKAIVWAIFGGMMPVVAMVGLFLLLEFVLFLGKRTSCYVTFSWAFPDKLYSATKENLCSFFPWMVESFRF